MHLGFSVGMRRDAIFSQNATCEHPTQDTITPLSMSVFRMPQHQLCQQGTAWQRLSLQVTSASRSHQTASGDSRVCFLALLPSFLHCMPTFGGAGGLGASTAPCHVRASALFMHTPGFTPLSCLSPFSRYSILTNQWFDFFPQKSIIEEIRKVSKKENSALGSGFIQGSGICWLVSGFCFHAVSCKLGC